VSEIGIEMRVFAVSDVHVDYEVNAKWIASVSVTEYRDDVLILAGDVTDTLRLLEWCLTTLAMRFKKVLFVPGNHDLWVVRERRGMTSFQKFDEVVSVVESSGASMQPFRDDGILIVPLLGWYDYSFGEPSVELRSVWMDYHACRWPAGFGVEQIASHFTGLNEKPFPVDGADIITFSHFLPRVDVMPRFISREQQYLYPVLGTTKLEEQLRRWNSSIHIYGHSHVNRSVTIDGILYINNAFGYPHETRITSKRLMCVYQS
jgi:predicted phosphodiesterase